MDGEGDLIHSKKAHKKVGKHHVLTASKNNRSKQALVPPSYTADEYKSPPLQKSASRNDRFQGLWEFYYDKEISGGDRADDKDEDQREELSLLKNIRGFLLKRRKSPLKGWHKRYFVLERGILYFSRTEAQIAKGKALGSLDLGLAFIHADGSSRRIDIDGEHHVHHLKTKNSSQFAAWSSLLHTHEMYRKAHLASGSPRTDGPKDDGINLPKTDGFESWILRTQDAISSIRKDLEATSECMDNLALCFSQITPSLNFASGLSQAPLDMKPLETTADSVSLHSVSTFSNGESVKSGGGDSVKSGSGDSVKPAAIGETGTGKQKKGKVFRKGKSDKKISKDSFLNVSPEQQLPIPMVISNFEDPSLLIIENDISRENSTEFMATAKLVFAQFSEMVEKIKKLDDGLPKALQQSRTQQLQQEQIITNQQQLLRQSLNHNTELRERLAQIQGIASGIETLSLGTSTGPSARKSPSQTFHMSNRGIRRFDSFMSLQSSISEKFFDALDDLHEQSSDDSEGEIVEDDSAEEESDSDVFESLTDEVISSLKQDVSQGSSQSTPSIYTLAKNLSIKEEPTRSPNLSCDRGVKRRTKLPCPVPDTGDLSLWGILRKNIGKDLSKVSMPVTLNEPLSALQRLCEELEFSELLDEAAKMDDPYDRMVRVAAFAVSAYALSYHRVGRKPFNPLLGETYECVREDKGFKFIAEQVSHHPPIAACHCESPNFLFWQDARIKSKFWGKSMEVFPIGTVNVTLPAHGDHYQWEKVTSCIHNVFGGQRWVDQYGEMIITNLDKCSCKLTFVKASYWSNTKYQVHGDVFDAEGVAVRHLFGAWHEAMFCGVSPESAQCIWRAAPMPPDYEDYYGFSQFSIELNNIEEGLKDLLPCCDSRFRPDQRMLEDGLVHEAEEEKHRVEQLQRATRAERARLGQDWTPHFFCRAETETDSWVFRGDYWHHRETQFSDITLPRLW